MLLSRKPRLSREQALAARPLRLPSARFEESSTGARLKVPMRAPKWGGWLLRFPDGATKTFELDSVGVFVWECCDGSTSVKQIILRLAKRYELNLREAEVSSLAFLQLLAKKGLIGMQVENVE